MNVEKVCGVKRTQIQVFQAPPRKPTTLLYTKTFLCSLDPRARPRTLLLQCGRYIKNSRKPTRHGTAPPHHGGRNTREHARDGGRRRALFLSVSSLRGAHATAPAPHSPRSRHAAIGQTALISAPTKLRLRIHLLAVPWVDKRDHCPARSTRLAPSAPTALRSKYSPGIESASTEPLPAMPRAGLEAARQLTHRMQAAQLSPSAQPGAHHSLASPGERNRAGAQQAEP